MQKTYFTDTKERSVTVSHGTIANPDGELTVDAKKIGVEPRSQGDRIMQAIIRNEEYASMTFADGPDGANKGLKYELGKPTSVFQPANLSEITQNILRLMFRLRT